MRQGNVRSGTVYLIPNFRSYSGGAYIFETWLEGSWTVNGGLRFDYQRTTVYPIEFKNITYRIHEYQSLSGAVGAIWHFTDEWSLGGNLGTAWRPPSINELYSNDVHHGTAQFEIGNIDLTTERSYSADVTLKPNPTLTIRGAFPTFRYKQADALLRGLDGMLEYRVFDELRLGMNFSLVRGDNLDTREPLIAMPADRVRFSLHLDMGEFSAFSKTYVDLGASLVRKQDRVPAHADYANPPAGCVLTDVGCGSELSVGAQDIILDVSVQNIFNRSYRDYLSRYRYFVDDPGVNAVLRIRVPFGTHNQQ
jgi:iron complex outermembrane receptor protein